MNQRYFSRKFILTLLVIILATLLLLFTFIESSMWVTVCLASLAFYQTANVSQKYKETKEVLNGNS
jgi:hypothetical protein